MQEKPLPRAWGFRACRALLGKHSAWRGSVPATFLHHRPADKVLAGRSSRLHCLRGAMSPRPWAECAELKNSPENGLVASRSLFCF